MGITDRLIYIGSFFGDLWVLFCDITLEIVYCVFRFYMISLGHVADFMLNLCMYTSVYCIFWEENKHLTSLIIIPCNVENM